MMEEQTNFFTESKIVVEKYIQDRILLLKLEAAEKTSKIVALMFTGLVIALITFFILLFLSIMAGYSFATLTGSMVLGFGIVAAIYVILLIILLTVGKKFLSKFITNNIINIMFEPKTDDDDDRNN